MKHILTLALLLPLVAGCSLFSDDIPALSAAELQIAPEVVVLGGQQISLSSLPYRDFLSTDPSDNGRGLGVYFNIKTVQSTPLPTDVTFDAIYVVFQGNVWSGKTEIHDGPRVPSTLYGSASGGPKWGPGGLVDVVIRLRGENGVTVLLRDADVDITRQGIVVGRPNSPQHADRTD